MQFLNKMNKLYNITNLFLIPLFIFESCSNSHKNQPLDSKSQQTIKNKQIDTFEKPCNSSDIEINTFKNKDSVIIDYSFANFDPNNDGCWFSLREFAYNKVPEKDINTLILKFWQMHPEDFSNSDEARKNNFLIAVYIFNKKTGYTNFNVNPNKTTKYIEK